MSRPRPRLCVALPVFNGQNYLAAAIESLLEQTWSDFELLIVDNASTDATQDICRTYEARDCRVRYLRHQSNIGAARNWFFALGCCSAELFKWAAHDDLYAPEFLERCVAVLDADLSAVLSYTRTTFIDEVGRPVRNLEVHVDTTSTNPDARLRSVIGVNHYCVQMYGVVRTAVLKQTPPYAGYFGWDWNTLTDLALLGALREVPEYLFYHRLHQLALGAGMWSGRSQKQLALQDPTINWRLDYSFARRALNYTRSVRRAPLTRQERRRCYVTLVTVGRQTIAQKLFQRMKRLRIHFRAHQAP